MNINTNQIVSISEANQNFSKIARLVDKSGEVYIFKNNIYIGLYVFKQTVIIQFATSIKYFLSP